MAQAAEGNKSTYKMEGLCINGAVQPEIEENLMAPNFVGLKSIGEGSKRITYLHLEIKVKSSIDCLPQEYLGPCLQMFCPHLSTDQRLALEKRAILLRKKRDGVECSQFYLRDIVKKLRDGKLKDSPKKINPFNGPAFFSTEETKRVSAIRQLCMSSNNYLRVFDENGHRVAAEKYDSFLTPILGHWEETLPVILANAIPAQLLGVLQYLQAFAGTSLGDLLYKLVCNGYAGTKASRGRGYLLTNSMDILEAILSYLNKFPPTQTQPKVDNISSEIIANIEAKLRSQGKEECCKDLALRFYYIALLVVMGFCDTSVIVKLALSPDSLDNSSLTPRERMGKIMIMDKNVNWASRCSMIDFGAKKDENVEKLIETYAGLDQYIDNLKE